MMSTPGRARTDDSLIKSQLLYQLSYGGDARLAQQLGTDQAAESDLDEDHTTRLPARFWAKVHKTANCWVWVAAVNNKGYPCFAVAGQSQLAHRLAYEDSRGPIPHGLTIDHLCRVRNCVRPDHLELVTVGENIRRAHGPLVVGSECIRGHAIRSESDLYRSPSKRLTECRECRRIHGRRRMPDLAPELGDPADVEALATELESGASA